MADLESLKSALRVSPDNPPLLALYAQACLEAFLPNEALGAYQRVLELSPGDRPGQLGVARCLFQMGRTSESIVRLEAYLGAGDEPSARMLLARALLADGSRDQARAAYTKALSLPGAAADPELERELGVGAGSPAGRASGPNAPTRLTTSGDTDADDDEDDEDDDDGRGESVAFLEAPRTSFDDVGGMEALKEEIRMKILYPLTKPELFQAYGKKAGGGVLLYGPPGCGKTLLSRATAGEMKARFLSVGIHQILDMYLGNSERELHAAFEAARDHAPCIVFFDEIDALAASRTDLRRSAGRTLVNQFLSEMDGAERTNEKLLVLGATNAPWHVDPAFLRPGRFDRVIFVPPPDEEARTAIVELLARGRPVADLDAKLVAKKTQHFSGADLRQVFEQATETCLAAALKKGQVVPLTGKEILRAAEKYKPTTRTWFETAKNHALYSNPDGRYDEVLAYLGIQK
jgi:AAA+ superfamily predicted ATPase